ncbi:MAG: hypothetical protein LBV67_04725 [Streptococcaceae bacterium]|jgi:hypothetical protein|nr:hypothetical protein [Streptococcaceae bacterium]
MDIKIITNPFIESTSQKYINELERTNDLKTIELLAKYGDKLSPEVKSAMFKQMKIIK